MAVMFIPATNNGLVLDTSPKDFVGEPLTLKEIKKEFEVGRKFWYYQNAKGIVALNMETGKPPVREVAHAKSRGGTLDLKMQLEDGSLSYLSIHTKADRIIPTQNVYRFATGGGLVIVDSATNRILAAYAPVTT